MSWNDLSMAERALYIRLGVQNGITDLGSIRSIYDAYNKKTIDSNRYDGNTEDTQLMQRKKGVNLLPYIAPLLPIPYLHLLNRGITDEEVVDSYLDNVLYTMENPDNKGKKRNSKWGMYTDRGIDGITRRNYGPGIEEHSNVGAKLKYNEKTTYSKEYLDNLVRQDLLDKAKNIRLDLRDMYGLSADTMSLGNRIILLDIAHNVKSKGSKRKNMPKSWPNLVKSMMTGNTEEAVINTDSGSDRRRKMRNQLLWKNTIDSNTVKNE